MPTLKKLTASAAEQEKFLKSAPNKDERLDITTRQPSRSSVTVSIAVKRDDLARIDKYCEKYGLTRSSFFKSAALKEIALDEKR